MVKNSIIAFNPDGPKSNASKEVPNLNHFSVFFGNPFPKNNFFPVEAIMVAHANPTKFMHDEGSPSPSSPSLNAIPKLMFNRFANIREVENTLL